eukprot:5067908-Prymnesium_polylepis.1
MSVSGSERAVHPIPARDTEAKAIDTTTPAGAFVDAGRGVCVFASLAVEALVAVAPRVKSFGIAHARARVPARSNAFAVRKRLEGPRLELPD